MTESDTMRRIGQLARRERLGAGVTAERLARDIGCSKAQLSLMESGQRTITIERARDIEKALAIRDGRLVRQIEWLQTPPTVRKSMNESQQRNEAMVEDIRRALRARNPVRELRGLVDAAGAAQRAAPPAALRHLPGFHRIPLINKVAAGYPREFTDLDYPASVADEYIACPEVSDPDAFAARVVGDSMEPEYREGDIVVFAPALDTPPGCDCFIRLDRDNQTTFKRVYFEDDQRTIRLQPLNNAYPPRIVDREDVAGMYVAVYVMRRVKPASAS